MFQRHFRRRHGRLKRLRPRLVVQIEPWIGQGGGVSPTPSPSRSSRPESGTDGLSLAVIFDVGTERGLRRQLPGQRQAGKLAITVGAVELLCMRRQLHSVGRRSCAARDCCRHVLWRTSLIVATVAVVNASAAEFCVVDPGAGRRTACYHAFQHLDALLVFERDGRAVEIASPLRRKLPAWSSKKPRTDGRRLSI